MSEFIINALGAEGNPDGADWLKVQYRNKQGVPKTAILKTQEMKAKYIGPAQYQVRMEKVGDFFEVTQFLLLPPRGQSERSGSPVPASEVRTPYSPTKPTGVYRASSPGSRDSSIEAQVCIKAAVELACSMQNKSAKVYDAAAMLEGVQRLAVGLRAQLTALSVSTGIQELDRKIFLKLLEDKNVSTDELKTWLASKWGDGALPEAMSSAQNVEAILWLKDK